MINSNDERKIWRPIVEMVVQILRAMRMVSREPISSFGLNKAMEF